MCGIQVWAQTTIVSRSLYQEGHARAALEMHSERYTVEDLKAFKQARTRPYVVDKNSEDYPSKPGGRTLARPSSVLSARLSEAPCNGIAGHERAIEIRSSGRGAARAARAFGQYDMEFEMEFEHLVDAAGRRPGRVVVVDRQDPIPRGFVPSLRTGGQALAERGIN